MTDTTFDFLSRHRLRSEQEKAAVKEIGQRFGYGRVMQLCEELWREDYPGGGEHTTGPCAAFMVPCPHLDKDKHGHCEWCCGAGRVTKYVRDWQLKLHGKEIEEEDRS